MNMATAFGEKRRDDREEAGAGAPTLAIGGDERRMHVRAYNHWVSLLKGRAYPSIEDLDPSGIADFGPNSVLLDSYSCIVLMERPRRCLPPVSAAPPGRSSALSRR